MGPATEDMPGAGDGRELSLRIERFLPSIPGALRLQIRLALLAFEWLPFPRRFSRLDIAARERLLIGMETSRLPLRRDLLLLAKLLFNLAHSESDAVRKTIGAEMNCRLAGEESSTAEAESALPMRLEQPDGSADCDVLVIGSGAGGAAAALRLAEAGIDVLILEAGGNHRHNHSDGEVMPSLARLYRNGGLTVAGGRPTLPIPVGRTVGGTTVINSGTCFRAPDRVLESWAERHGIGWATDLDRTFAVAERDLQVSRLDAAEMGRNGELAMRGANRLGVSGRPLDRNAGHCVQCSGCPLGCPIDAKQSMAVSYLPRALAAGARLMAGVEAERLIFDGEHCVGADCSVRPLDRAHTRDSTATPLTVRARRVIVAGGALGTPEVLLRSGVGGPTVGRGLHVHPATWVGALYPEPVEGWKGVMQSYYIDQWKERGLFLEATFTPLPFGGAWLPGAGRAFQRALRNYGRVGSIGVHLTDHTSVGRVSLTNDGIGLNYRLSREEARKIAFGIARAAEIHFAAGASEVYPNIAGLPRLLPDRMGDLDTDRIRGPDLRLEAFHPMGTARIDPDPRHGVCGPDGRVHGTRGLYVADASLFPTALGVNPMMTVIAFADRIATLLIQRSI